jgi:hypothetical protein
MLRAFALYVALMISVVVALICGSLLTLYYLNDKEYYLVETDRRLRNNVESAFSWVRENELKEGVVVKDLFEENRDSVQITTRDWGFLNLISCKAFSGSRSKTKSALMGPLMHSSIDYALYMGNSNKPLSLCGEVKLMGDCFVPDAGVRRAYIEGQNFMGDKLINGEEKKSASSLPEINKEFVTNVLPYLKGEHHPEDSVLAYSADSTKVINFSGEKVLLLRSSSPIVLSNIQYKGKVIVQSSQWIRVKKDAQLEDILLFAPAIFVDDDFKGSAQFIASDSLVVGEDCNFLYPTVLAVVNESQDDKSVVLTIGEGTQVKGAVISYKEKQSVRSRNFVALAKETEVFGLVYSNGFLELKGEVFGSVVCQSFILRTASSVYENHLLNTTIDITKLPKNYVGVNWLKKESHYDIIKFF